jgi:hypothetical protein
MENLDLIDSRYEFNWIGRCTFDTSDKVWGVFWYHDPTLARQDSSKHSNAYVFWARTGKNISFKKHPNSTWNIRELIQKKSDRKYVQIRINDLIDIWPNVIEDINNAFIFHLLANDI